MYIYQFEHTTVKDAKEANSDADKGRRMNDISRHVVNIRFDVKIVPMCDEVHIIHGMVPPGWLLTFGNDVWKHSFQKWSTLLAWDIKIKLIKWF